jgi:hypothetical protein
MVRSLQLVDLEISKNGNLTDWFHIAKERAEWNDLIESLDSPDNFFDLDTSFDPDDDPTPVSDDEDLNYYSPRNSTKIEASHGDSPLLGTSLETEGIRSASQRHSNWLVPLPPRTWDDSADYLSRPEHFDPPPPNPDPESLLARRNCQPRIITTGSWPYTGHLQPQWEWPYSRESIDPGQPTTSPFPAHYNVGHSSLYFFDSFMFFMQGFL